MNAPLTVNRARLFGARAGRADLERWLGAVPIERLGLAPEEILYVPALRLRVSSDLRRPCRALGESVLDRLRLMLESAERDPVVGRNARGGCRFSSRARFLAWVAGLWLLRDNAVAAAASGAPSLREWQRRELLCDGAVLAPVAVRLAESGLAGEWLVRFEDHDHALAGQALARSFGVDLVEARAALALSAVETFDAGRRSDRGGRPPDAPTAAPNRWPKSKLSDLSSELATSGNGWQALTPEARLLLLAAAAVVGAPGHAARPGFAAQLAAAVSDEAEVPPLGLQQRRLTPGRAPSDLSQRREAGGSTQADRPSDDVRLSASEEPLGRGIERRLGGPRTPAMRARVAGDEAQPFAEPTAEVRDTPTTAISPAAIAFESGFCGLLLLLNAFTALGLYPDFAGAAPPRIRPSPLRLIDRIGRRWFGARYHADPLSGWIVAHSRAGPLSRSWRAEPEWVEAWGRGRPLRPAERAGRLTLWHEAGFPAVDMPAARGCLAPRLARAAGATVTRAKRRSGARLPRLPIARDERWVACFAYFLDARIRNACGMRSAGLNSLALAGALAVDELEVTARFELDSYPVALRLAGLDRDPGWQPAEGRGFRFRFE